MSCADTSRRKVRRCWKLIRRNRFKRRGRQLKTPHSPSCQQVNIPFDENFTISSISLVIANLFQIWKMNFVEKSMGYRFVCLLFKSRDYIDLNWFIKSVNEQFHSGSTHLHVLIGTELHRDKLQCKIWSQLKLSATINIDNLMWKIRMN